MPLSILEMSGVILPREARAGERPIRTHKSDDAAQPLIGASEPLPFGVFIDVQVPLSTYFQALP
jgi:hypothetical protein